MLVKLRDELWVCADDVSEVWLNASRDTIVVKMKNGHTHGVGIERALPHVALDALVKRISDAAVSAAGK